jgi:hypothetical protein
MSALWRLPAAALLVAACSACANTGAQEYRALPLPSETYAVPQDVFAAKLRSFPEGREGRQELELSLSKDGDGNYIVLLTVAGLLDDSVGAEQHRAVLRFESGRWRVTQLGERWRCQPDRGATGWGTSHCH